MFMDPTLVLARCNLQSTDNVAEFGAGAGAMARAIAVLVPQGNVFAIDIQRDVVQRLARDAADAHLPHFHALWGDIEIKGGSMLANDAMNAVILSNTLLHLDDKEAPFREAHRVLVPEGKLLVVDWLADTAVSPHPSRVVPKEHVLSLGDRTGFFMVNDTLPAGDHHYAILFKKVARN